MILKYYFNNCYINNCNIRVVINTNKEDYYNKYIETKMRFRINNLESNINSKKIC